MNERELRELDVRVHRALWPDDSIQVGEQYGRKVAPNEGIVRPIPYYTTDITAWEPVYALKPEWMWTFEQVTGDDGRRAWDVYVAAPVPGARCYRTYETPYIYEGEASGWAAVALGMARCVIARAAGRGEG